MTRRHVIAIAVAVMSMVLALAQPLWVRTTGTEVYLDLAPVDPLSFFRGNYVDLRYNLEGVDGEFLEDSAFNHGDLVYVTLDDSRPAQALALSSERPKLADGERCLRGEKVGNRVTFPALEQYFVTPEEGRRLETDMSSMVGVVKTTSSCRGILVTIERE